MSKEKKPERRHEPAPIDRTAFNVLMNEHFHATQQCLCGLAVAIADVLHNGGGLAAALDARINDPTTDRTPAAETLLSVVRQAVLRHDEQNSRFRT